MWPGRLIFKRRIGRPAVIVAVLLAISGATDVLGTAVIEWANPATGRFVPVSGGRLHVVEKVPEDGSLAGPAVVLIHGAAANLHDQEAALGDRLSQRYRVLLIDR